MDNNNELENLDDVLRSMAYDRGHSAGVEEVESIYASLRGEILPAVYKDIKELMA